MSDPLTYWWGATPCPPELNDVALAETVVILMRYAAIEKVNLNTEVQKPSLANVLEFKGATMECASESTPHEETCIYTSALEGGSPMQKFKDDELQDMADDGDGQKEQGYPIRATEYMLLSRLLGQETRRRKQGNCRRNKAKAVSSSKTRKSMGSIWRVVICCFLRGTHVSLPIGTNGQLNPIDFKRPTEVMANGPDGLVTSDSHSRTTGVALLSGSRLPAMTALGRKYLIGKDCNGLPQLEGP